jgi:hypothetical protein
MTIQYLFIYTLAFTPRSSSAPNRGSNNVNGRHQHNADDYTQHILRSPSHGNNFIMQSNHSTVANLTNTRDQFFLQTVSPPPPPPPPALLIPAPPPLPTEFLTSRSSPWSTLQLPESSRKGRSRANTNLCKFFKMN